MHLRFLGYWTFLLSPLFLFLCLSHSSYTNETSLMTSNFELLLEHKDKGQRTEDSERILRTTHADDTQIYLALSPTYGPLESLFQCLKGHVSVFKT